MLLLSILAIGLALALWANVQRYRWGETRPISHPVKAGVAVSIGDLCFRDTSDSNTLKPASSLTWVSAVSTPSAPTGATETGAAASSLTSGATGLKVAYVFPWGEGTLSTAGSVTVTGNGDAIRLDGIDMSGLPTGTRRAIYVETSQGSGTYKLWNEDYGGANLIAGYGVGRTPPTAVAQTATAMTQYAFHQAFAGVSSQAYDGSNANAYGIKDGRLRCAQGGVYEFDCASADFVVGAIVGPAKASGNTLEPQKVVEVTHELLGCGRVAEAGTSLTKVKVTIMSPISSLLQ